MTYEIRDVPGYAGWQADTDGIVYLDGEAKGWLSNGYVRVYLGLSGPPNSPCKSYAHILVCTAFHGECPPGLECTHRNDVHDDNRPSNLKWDTHKQNCVEAYMNGRLPITKLTDDDIIEMRELYTSKRFKQVDLALIYGVSQRTVSEHLST